MVTIVWRTTDGRVFKSEVEANRHQVRIALKALLLEAPIEEQLVGDKEGTIGGFAERLTEWTLSEPTRTNILEILRADNPDVPQPVCSLEGKSKTGDQRISATSPGATTQTGTFGDAVRGLRTAKE